MSSTIKTDVIIIGAGPTGLSLASQLTRYGINFIIIDQNESITPYSKAIGVHARTLEIYDQIGLATHAIEQGTIAGKACLLVEGKIRGEIEFSNIGEGLSAFPFILLLEQSKNEKLFAEYLQNQQKEVSWQTTLTTFSQTEQGVTAHVKTANGTDQIIEARYLVGCDGPKSLVRHTLGLTFEGGTYERLFYVADAQIDWDFSHTALHVCLAQNSFLLFFPLKGEKRYRIVGMFPAEFTKEEGSVLYSEIEHRIQEEAKFKLNIHDIEWFSTYKVHTRRAEKFAVGNCFLAGDAAHIHSPAGAQGMNTGIQDAYNLAWKLAFVIQGKANKKLLTTYNDERLENAKHLLKTTDRMFELAAGPGWLLKFLRMDVLPRVAKYILSLNIDKKFIFKLVSQIGIHYPDSSLSSHEDETYFKIKAGERMPYFLLDEKNIYDKLRQPNFHFLIFSDSEKDFQELEASIKNQYGELIDFAIIQINSTITDIFGAKKSFSLLLRPDNYISFISTDISLRKIQDYLVQCMMY